jgi:hypothetical protein
MHDSGFFWFFPYVLYSTLLHLAPLIFQMLGSNPGLLRLRDQLSRSGSSRATLPSLRWNVGARLHSAALWARRRVGAVHLARPAPAPPPCTAGGPPPASQTPMLTHPVTTTRIKKGTIQTEKEIKLKEMKLIMLIVWFSGNFELENPVHVLHGPNNHKATKP